MLLNVENGWAFLLLFVCLGFFFVFFSRKPHFLTSDDCKVLCFGSISALPVFLFPFVSPSSSFFFRECVCVYVCVLCVLYVSVC